MKYDVTQELVNYRGEPILMTDKKNAPPATLREVLEFVLVNASPEEFRAAADKHSLYRLLKKVSGAKPYLDVESAEIELLKKAAAILPVVALGAVFDMLEAPVTPAKAPAPDRIDSPVAEIPPQARADRH